MIKREQIMKILEEFYNPKQMEIDQYNWNDYFPKITDTILALEPEQKVLTEKGKIAEARRLMFEVTKDREKQKKIQTDNQLCECGHSRNNHAVSHSINYTEGFCSKCKCEHFLLAFTVMPLDETGTPNASGYFVNKQPIEQSEIKGAKAELDLLQYVTNMLYMAANEGPTMGNPAFDKWVDQQIELLREYAHQPQKEQEDDEDDDTDD
jgi:hypothetical protein